MDDKQILSHIDELIATEHDLRGKLAAGDLSTDEEHAELRSVEEALHVAGATRFGLQCGLFTSDVRALTSPSGSTRTAASRFSFSFTCSICTRPIAYLRRSPASVGFRATMRSSNTRMN